MQNKYDNRFKDLKSKIGIDDVALHLGYKIDRRAGIGKFIELYLSGTDGKAADRIIVSHPSNRSLQTYFRRGTGRGGDVFDFVAENLNQFNVSGRNQWDVTMKVLSKLANEPLPERDFGYLQSISRNEKFNASLYDIRPLFVPVPSSGEHLPFGSNASVGNEVYAISEQNLQLAMKIFKPRGITEETVRAFAGNIHLFRNPKYKYKGYNVGFPYTVPGKAEVVGYEVRGNGTYKGKPSGTNSSTAVWLNVNPGGYEADCSPNMVRTVYFAESAFDIMAFFQTKGKELYNPSAVQQQSMAFVSLGGTFSAQQVKGVMEHFPNAKAVDCFDNDIYGRIYGMRMVSVVENLALKLTQTAEGIEVDHKGTKYLLPSDANLNSLKKFILLKREYGVYKPPKEFKDWNDVVMNREIKDLRTSPKQDLKDRLRESRNLGMKI